MKKILCVLLAFLIVVFSGCSTKTKYNPFIANSEAAIMALEDAIATVDMCIAGEITPEEACDDLEVLEAKVDTEEISPESSAASSISIASMKIRNELLRVKIGSGTNVSVKKAVQEAKEYLCEELYGK